MAFKAHLASPSQSSSDPSAQNSIEGRRQSRRALRLETSGALPGGLESNVTIHNISAAGLLLETDLPLTVGEVLAVDLPGAGPVGAEIVWESEHLFGCAFQQALGEAALAAAQLRGDARVGAGTAPGAAPDNANSPFEHTASDPFGIRLNRLRRERGLTLAQVASALGVSKPTVWAWEKGKARPLPERIAAIADVLGVSEEDLSANNANDQSAALVEECRIRIATRYGTDPRSVRIMIEV